MGYIKTFKYLDESVFSIESKKIASEIKKHGTKGQKTLDQLLSEI